MPGSLPFPSNSNAEVRSNTEPNDALCPIRVHSYASVANRFSKQAKDLTK